MTVHMTPEQFGLTVVGIAYDDSLSWEFDMFSVWKDEQGNLYWGYDSGCSCPSPFEDTTMEDLSRGTAAEAHSALDEWAKDQPGKQSSAAELHLVISRL